jgi:hypothetical protein
MKKEIKPSNSMLVVENTSIKIPIIILIIGMINILCITFIQG